MLNKCFHIRLNSVKWRCFLSLCCAQFENDCIFVTVFFMVLDFNLSWSRRDDDSNLLFIHIQ